MRFVSYMLRIAKVLILNYEGIIEGSCRRKDPILGYGPKNDEEKNSGNKGLSLTERIRE